MRDPLGYVDGPNVYAYVTGNPAMGIDPLGLEDWNCESCFKWRKPDNWHGPEPVIKIRDNSGTYHLRQDGSWQNGKAPKNPGTYVRFFGPKGENWLKLNKGKQDGYANPVALYLSLLLLAIPVIKYVNDHLPRWEWPVSDPKPKEIPTSCPGDMGGIILG
jgi:uncharacterized protein RhaS with RHS repeats